MLNRTAIQKIKHVNWTTPNYKITISALIWRRKKLTKLNHWNFRNPQNLLWIWPLFHPLCWGHWPHKKCPSDISTYPLDFSVLGTLDICTLLLPHSQPSPAYQWWCPHSPPVFTSSAPGFQSQLVNQTGSACRDQCCCCFGPYKPYWFQIDCKFP